MAANNSLVVGGDAFIGSTNFNNHGTVFADSLTITVENFDANIDNTGTILSDSLNFILTDDFTYTSTSFSGFTFNNLAITTDGSFTNNATINLAAGSLEITAGYTAINQGSIVSGRLDLTAADFFRNLTGDISVDSLNIIAGGKVTNTANITVGTLNITANNDSSRDDDPAGAFFYVSNRGNITATTLNIAAVDNFYNRGNITATNFTTRAKDIFFLNREIDSFYAAGNPYDGGNIFLNGDSSFIADGGIIENYGNIDLGVFNLDLTANSFTNHADANVTADTLNLDVSSFVQRGVINATINQASNFWGGFSY